MSKVALFLAEGFEPIEALTTVDVLRRLAVQIDTVSISENREVISSHNIPVKADKLISDICFEDYQMLVLPGGVAGTANLEKCEPLKQQLVKFHNEGKYIAAICAAPSIFAHLGLIDGMITCVNPGYQSHIEAVGEVCYNQVNESNKIITSRAMGTSLPFALKIASIVKSEKEAEDLAKVILYDWNK